MRMVTINLGAGQDTSVDPRVAPNGAFVRAENCRLDKQGRLVSRRGYTSLGTTVTPAAQIGIALPGALVPFDLIHFRGDLYALGNNAAVQTGIRCLYRYSNTVQGAWWAELLGSISQPDQNSFSMLPVSSDVKTLQQDVSFAPTDTVGCDVAISGDGRYVCWVGTAIDNASGNPFATVAVWDTTIGAFTYRGDLNFSAAQEAAPRVLWSSGSIFKIFTQQVLGTNIRVRSLDMSQPIPNPSLVAVNVGTAAVAFPAPYDVAPFEGTTDYLVCWATALNTSWTRYNAADVSVSGNATVGLAGAACAIQGATGETINVVRQRTTDGYHLITYNPTTGALAVGPTNLDVDSRVYTWVSVVRESSTSVFVQALSTVPTVHVLEQRSVTTAAHVSTVLVDMNAVRPVSKPFPVSGLAGVWFQLIVMGQVAPACVGIVQVPLVAGATPRVQGIMLDGLAQVDFAAATAPMLRQVVQRSGTVEFYAATPTKDPRDKTFRSALSRFKLFSGERRQAAAVGDQLYIAGGNVTLWDQVIAGEAGFETAPQIVSLSVGGGGGALTLLGTYTYQAIFRVSLPSGRVIQSAPSEPRTLTLTGGNSQTNLQITTPFGLRRYGAGSRRGEFVYLDLYRTEAGGSIPRLIITRQILTSSAFGSFESFSDGIADAVQQTGVAMYTQGAEGSVSGRLPLGIPSPAGLLAESDGRLLLASLESDTLMQFSIEGRPGETAGFVNDDLFFIQNPEPITALGTSNTGRRFIFGRNNIRELIGQGPNAAGVGEIAEPVEICSHVGAADWRSVYKTEHGLFFGSSYTDAEEAKICLLPEGGGTAVVISDSIRDVLALYPVITSVTRHDDEQLLSFTLQNVQGNDGRLVHLDLRSSGLTNRGWVGKWFVDRVAAFEATPFPEVVAELTFGGLSTSSTDASGGVVTIPLPQGQQLGDRIIIWLCHQELTLLSPSAISSYTKFANAFSAQGMGCFYERILSTTGSVGANSALAFVFEDGVTFGRVWLIRGSHPSAPSEVSSNSTGGSVTVTSQNPVSPSWGAANTLWISTCMIDSFVTGGITRAIRAIPPGFGSAQGQVHRTIVAPAVMSMETMTCVGKINTATLSGANYTFGISTSYASNIIAIRPAVSAGTPLRASTHHRGRLVVCNSTDVLVSNQDAVADQDGSFVSPLIETCDLYPMGEGGAGRHTGLVFVGELLGFCQLTPYLSYDGGFTWVGLQFVSLFPRSGYQIGQTLRITWVPSRRKIEGVRARLVVSEQNLTTPLPGDTRGVAMNRLIFVFDELIGTVRQPAGRQQ